MPLHNEHILQEQVCQYIRYQYPDVLFHSDFGSGVKLNMGQAVRQKKVQKTRAWPDLFIAHPNYDQFLHDEGTFGLFIELKAEGTRLKKKDGTWSSPHLAEQAEVLDNLRERGYEARFGVGFEQCKEIIDNYLK